MTKDKLRKIMGENIRNERISRDLSIDELAELLGLTPGFVGLIERGKRGATAHTLYKLIHVLDVPIAQLFENPSGASLKLAEENPAVTKRAKLNSIIYDFNEHELDFLISIIKSVKIMQSTVQGKLLSEDDGDDDDD